MRKKTLSILAAISLTTGAVFATDPQCDQVVFKGEQYGMLQRPLAPLLREKKVLLDDGYYSGTGGYRSLWRIENDKFYLVAFAGWVIGPNGRELWDMARFLPDSRTPVHAIWFTGRLVIPVIVDQAERGAELAYSHRLVFEIEKGMVKDKYMERLAVSAKREVVPENLASLRQEETGFRPVLKHSFKVGPSEPIDELDESITKQIGTEPSHP